MKLRNNFVRIKAGVYVNEDHIVSLLNTTTERQVITSDGEQYTLSGDEFNALLKIVGPVLTAPGFEPPPRKENT